MPFDKNNASKSGKIGGRRSAEIRWKDKAPDSVRNKHIGMSITQAELSMIDEKAAAEGISRVELIVRAVRAYQNQ